MLKRKLAAGLALLAAFALGGPLAFSPYTAWLLSLPVMFWCAGHFHAGLLRGMRDRRFGLHLLASSSAWALFLLSTAAVFAGERLPVGLREPRFLSLTAMVTLVNLGLWFEALFQKKTPGAILRLSGRVPSAARVLREGREVLLPLEEARRGELFVVRPGEPVPVDGVVLEGYSRVEEWIYTGVSEPVEKRPGTRVRAGSVNKTGRLVLAARSPTDSALKRLSDEVASSAAGRHAAARAVDPVAQVFFVAVLAAAGAAAAVGALRGPQPRLLFAGAAFLSVLSSACPWAVGLASPLALFFGALRGARFGIGLRNPRLLESFRKPDAVLFDKTGVLSEGRPALVETLAFGGWTEAQVVSALLRAEEHVEHPLLAALRRGAPAVQGAARESFECFPHRGVCVDLDGRRVLAGSLAWIQQHGIEPSPEEAMRLKSRSDSLIVLAADGRLVGAVAFADALRPEARAAVERLGARGIEAVLVSGDDNPAAFRAAEHAGITKVYAESQEDEKAELVERLRAKGRRVALIGEGLTDCIALVRADLSLCGAGCPAPVEAAADFTLQRRDLDGFLEAVLLGLDVRAAIRRNLLIMFAVHALMIPASVWALYRGVRLGPSYSALTAAAATAAVLINSLRLLKRRPE